MAGAPIRVAILDPDTQAANRAREALGAADSGAVVDGVTPDITGLRGLLARSHPDVIVVDAAGVQGDLQAAVRELLMRAPESLIVVTAANAPATTVSRAVSAGARGFLLKPYTATDLITTVRDAYESSQQFNKMRTERAAPPARRGTILAVYSPKGGVGCTTISANLAVALAARPQTSVALIDLDLQFGDIGVVLDLKSANSIADLLQHGDSLDASVIDDVFVRHSSGVRVLPAPESLHVEHVDADQITRAIGSLRDHFDFIICDLWSSLDDLTVGVLRLADRVLLVTTPELPALKNLRRVVSMAGADLNLDGRTLVVVNRAGKVGLSLEEIERGLGQGIGATIPSQGVGVTAAINQGVSLLDDRSSTGVGRSYRNLADVVAKQAAQPPPAPAETVRPLRAS